MDIKDGGTGEDGWLGFREWLGGSFNCIEGRGSRSHLFGVAHLPPQNSVVLVDKRTRIMTFS